MSEEQTANQRPVLFRDASSGDQFLIESSVETDETISIEGEEYPLVELEVSSGSHPFYTGEQKLLDSEGRVERFQRKYGGYEDEESSSEEEGSG